MEEEALITEAGRRAAHILLDSIVAWSLSEEHGLEQSRLVAERLVEAGAVTTAHDPATDRVTVDVSGLLQGATNSMVMLISAVAASTAHGNMGDVIEGLRRQLDDLPRG